VSSESSCAVRLARHSQNAWARHVERVESCRVESSQVEFGLNWKQDVFCITTHWARRPTARRTHWTSDV